ncbi:MAG: hypothetical protein M3Q05_09765 [Bacteroidota bacterium]|nr:hypothetical protein [Bacteroidota bacterium]
MTSTELEQSLQLIFSLEYFSIYVGADKSLLYVNWKKQPIREEIQHGFDLIIGQLIAYNVKCWIANFSQMHFMEEKDQHWYAETLLPDLRYTKLQKVARVISGDYNSFQTASNLMDLANYNPQINNQIEHRVFTNIDSALIWFGIAPE